MARSTSKPARASSHTPTANAIPSQLFAPLVVLFFLGFCYDKDAIIANLVNVWKETTQAREVLKEMSNVVKYILIIIGPVYAWYKLYGQNPQEHVISVQMNVVVGSHKGSHCLDYEDAWKGDIMWNVLSSAPAPDSMFQESLATARKKPLALAKQCPKLGLLDTGPYDVRSVLWQKIYGFASSILGNTDAMARAACDLPVHRRRFIGCLTFESPEQLDYNDASRKMRMLLVSRKHLQFLDKNPNYGMGTDSNGWARLWQDQRLEQLRELARHVKETGGFDDQLYVQERNDRYYFQIEVWLKGDEG